MVWTGKMMRGEQALLLALGQRRRMRRTWSRIVTRACICLSQCADPTSDEGASMEERWASRPCVSSGRTSAVRRNMLP